MRFIVRLVAAELLLGHPINKPVNGLQ